MESWTELRTHKHRAADKDLEISRENPIIVRLSDFPFALLLDAHSERWPEGKYCIRGSMDKLEGEAE